jgi:hypothetical protein
MSKLGTNLLVIALTVGASASVAQAGDHETYTNLMEEHAAALVTVKFIPQLPNGDKRSEVTATATVISPDGLILCANSTMGGNPMGGPGITPTEIEILFGEETTGPKAEVIGRDTELDLAWLKITDELPKPLAYLDLKQDTMPKIGENIYAIRLMDEYYGRAAFVKPYKVAALLKKPRKLIAPSVVWMADSDWVGLPTFSADGKTVGLFIVQLPDSASRQNMRRPGDIIFVLPAKKIAIQTELALEQYAERKQEEADAAADNATSESDSAEAAATE